MKNKDIHEWLLDEGIDPLTTVRTEKGEYYLSDILEKHLTEQLRLFAVSGRSEQLANFCTCKKPWVLVVDVLLVKCRLKLANCH